MNRNLDSRTKLTEFAPLDQEENDGIGFLFSKFFKKSQPGDSKGETSTRQVNSDMNSRPSSDNYEKKERIADKSFRTEGDMHGRSLPKVLKRVRNLVALKSSGRQSYNDTELKQYWMPDSVSKECYDCSEKFTTFRRRHHCRICGQIFCSKCCNQEIPGKIINCNGDLRVCSYCGKIVLDYLESGEMAELSADLRALQDNLQVKFGSGGGSPSPNTMMPPSTSSEDKETQARRKTSVGYQEEKFATSFRYESSRAGQVEEEDKSSLLRLLEEAINSGGVELASHSFRLRTYPACFPSQSLITWLIVNNKANNSVQAVALGQAMLDSGYIEGIETEEFTETHNLYKVSVPMDPLNDELSQQGSLNGVDIDILSPDNQMNQSTSSFNLDLNVEDKIVHITKPPPDSSFDSEDMNKPVAEVDNGLKEVVENYLVDQPKSMNWDTIEPDSLESIDKTTYFNFVNVYEDHCVTYSRQLLNADGLSQTWIEVMIPLAKQIVFTVRPDLKTMDSLDIRNYVQVKKVCGGERSECTILSGVCCSKNLAHKAMPSSIQNPRILLLGCPISYERVEGKLLSLEPVIMQEQDYVANTVSRICALRPHLVLASRTVCRLAQDALLQAGVSFAVNVKWSTLERLARVTGADILTSVDATLGRPRLATCKHFYLKTFTTSKGSKKTLMMFEGCRETSLGGTVILRGGSMSELFRLKRVLLSLIFAYYNAKLEISYLMDAHALPPCQSKELIFEESQTYTSMSDLNMDMNDQNDFDKIKNLSISESNERFISNLSISSSDDRIFESSNQSEKSTPPPNKDGINYNLESASPDFAKAHNNLPPLTLILSTPPNPGPRNIPTTLPFNKEDDNLTTKNDVESDISSATPCQMEECLITKSNDKTGPIPSDQASTDNGKLVLPNAPRIKPVLGSERTASSSVDDINDSIYLSDVFTDCPSEISSNVGGGGCEEEERASDITQPSDPLQAYHYEDSPTGISEIPTQVLSVAELPLCNRFRKALEDNILSISPYLKLSLPYLESEVGRHCPLRCYFGRKLYWSKQLTDNHPIASRNNSSSYLDPSGNQPTPNPVKLKEPHQLVKVRLVEDADSLNVRTMLADFRARGSRLEPNGTLNTYNIVQNQSCIHAQSDNLDVLDPANHQRLPVLFSSYSPVSANAPTFCVDPWVVEMEFYGKYDIALGGFLQRYCFRPDYVCPSENCSVAMLYHTRRFVHNSSAIHVTLNRTTVPFKHDSILMWNWCKICNYVSPVVAMSNGTWALSFAKYLELRFHGDMYTLRCEPSCMHSLHHECVQYFAYKHSIVSFIYQKISTWEICMPPVQYFAYKHSIVSFIYQKISTWEICMPPVTVVTKYEKFSTNEVVEEIKKWTLVSHQIFSDIFKLLTIHSNGEGILPGLKQQWQKDQAYFKSRIEDLQMKLTSPTLLGEPDTEQVIQERWGVEDCMVLLKRLLMETVDTWNRILSDLEAAAIRRKKYSENRPASGLAGTDIIDGVTEFEGEVDSQGEVLTDCEEAGDPETPRSVSNSQNNETLAALSAERTESPPIAIPLQDGDDYEGCGPPQIDVKPLTDKKTVKAILSHLLPTQTTSTPIQNPMNESEHHILPLGFSVPVVVYEKELSSVIAYALSSHDYRQQIELLPTPNSPLWKRRSGSDMHRDSYDVNLGDRRSLLSLLRTSSTSSNEKGLLGRGIEGTSPNMTFDLDEDHRITVDSQDSKKNSKGQQSPNIEVQFSDSMANFKVKVYFAEDFARLRSLVLPMGEESFVRSLTHCEPWAASGGKSGSTFCKTKDDRFVLKELSRLETHIFLEIAPQYFTYMETCVRTKSPTLLGKILGVYRITFKHHVGNTTSRKNLLVMEHLFHARSVTDKFDLKGSMRNRLVDTTLINSSQRETVLLDQNLINMTCDNPLYILPHSKAILMQAIHNDTQFLASQAVMDYSLLVGLDRTNNNELVLGIIDYIRTFTWDKKLETMVKKYALGGQGRQPTIISPDEYRNRFIAAMHRYFLAVPDRWTGLAQGLGY